MIEKWKQKYEELAVFWSLHNSPFDCGTAQEAEIIHDEGGFKNKVVLVYHLPSVISIEEIYHFDRDEI